jgi:hypothetical protein
MISNTSPREMRLRNGARMTSNTMLKKTRLRREALPISNMMLRETRLMMRSRSLCAILRLCRQNNRK